MPFLLPAAATAVAAAAPAAAATTAAATAGATLTSIATNIAMNVAISAVMSALQPQVGAAGRTAEWTLSPDGPIPFAAGRIGVAGSVVHRATFGPDLMYLGVPAVLSGAGPIDGYESFKADDEWVNFDGNGKATSSQYAGELWYRRTMGYQPDVAVASPPGLKSNATLPGWGAQHKLSGKAAYMVVMGENSKGTAFPTGEIKPLITLRGLKGWDPRLDSTWPGGDGPCRLDNPATWVYLRRPGLWGLKWSLGLWEGPTLKGAPAHGSATDHQVGGIGAKLSGIDVAAFVNLENICDANDWTVSAYPTTDDDKFAVLESFLQAGGATFAMRAGKISCIQRAAPRTSIVTISAADTAGPLEIDTAASRIDRINTIRPRIMSEAHRWQMTAIAEVSAQAYRDQDGGVRPRGIDYTYVDKATQGAQLAALQIANTREGIAGVIPLKPHLQKIKPGDAFTITEPGFVLNGLKCLCLSTEFDPSTKIVAVSFVSETDAKYPFALGQSQEPPVPAELEPVDPRYVSPPGETEWTVVPRPPSDGGAQIPGFDVVGEVDNATATALLVEWGPGPEGPWTQAYLGPPTAERVPLTGIQPGQVYYVSVMNIRGQNYSVRRVMGPFTAPALVADDANALGSRAAQDVLDSLDALASDFAGIPAVVAAVEAAKEAAELAATNADGAADIAATKRDEAAGFSSSSQAAAVAARQTVVALLPSTFDQDGTYWRDQWYGEPGTAPLVANANFSFPIVAGIGKVVQTGAGASVDIAPDGAYRLQPNRRLKVTARYRQIAGPVTEVILYNTTLKGDHSPGTAYGSSSYLPAPALNTWVDLPFEFDTNPMLAAGDVFLRPLFRTPTTAGGIYQLHSMRVDDVTESRNALTQAQASAASSATAQTYRDQAGNSASSAALAAALAASVNTASLNVNPGFDDWTGLNADQPPAGWSFWMGNDGIRVPGPEGGFSWRGNIVPNANSGGITQLLPDQSCKGGKWYVIEAEVTFSSGVAPWSQSGVYYDFKESSDATSIWTGTGCRFSGPDVNGETNHQLGRRTNYAWLVQAGSDTLTNIARARIWALSNWNGFAPFGLNGNAGSIDWHKVVLRPATAAEVELQKARGGFGDLSAKLSDVSAVAAGATEALAGRVLKVEAGSDVRPNLLKNPSGVDGVQTGDWFTDFPQSIWTYDDGQGPDFLFRYWRPDAGAAKNLNLYQFISGFDLGVAQSAGGLTASMDMYRAGAAPWDGRVSIATFGPGGFIQAKVTALDVTGQWKRMSVTMSPAELAGATSVLVAFSGYFPAADPNSGIIGFRRAKAEYAANPSAYLDSKETLRLRSSVTQTVAALAALDGRVEGTAGLTVQAGGRVAGMRFHAVDGTDQNYSSIDFLADVFRVWDSVAATGRAPFEVRNGGVRMNAAFVDRLAIGTSLTVGSANLRVAVQPFSTTATDGVAKNYGYDLGLNPTLVFGPCPVPLNAGETYSPTADNQSPTGFMPRFKITTPGAPTNQSTPLNLAGTIGAQSVIYSGIVTPVKDGNVTINATGVVEYEWVNNNYGGGGGFEPIERPIEDYDKYSNGYVQLAIFAFNGSTWAKIDTLLVDGPWRFNDPSGVYQASFSAPWSGTIGSNITHLAIGLEYESHAGSYLGAATATYQTASAGATRSACPNGEQISVTVYPKNGA